jgi:hypothetical protein
VHFVGECLEIYLVMLYNSHSELARHVSIPCWDHRQGLLDYKLYNYKLTTKVHIKSIRCIKVKIVGYLCWFLGPLCIGNCNICVHLLVKVVCVRLTMHDTNSVKLYQSFSWLF